ncbi:cytochrome-c oxidase [Sporosarcina sp. HYO08]|uniref:cytochrome-c oxidase n=1 Tax=Sporosarcina sp. HYO08 TaxID=1759557 RepID=UPI000792A4CB|nr:cytochrome-c oxidase [Sporosarcina sp. HYO08]KXH84063.1 cytochrome-c oxidase [Sporosarcina sp. HYO08]
MGISFIKVAVVYFVIGVVLGMYMSISHNFDLSSVHAHVNLLGWVSAGLSGFIYLRFPNLTSSLLAKLHFWLFNIGIPVMLGGLTLLILTGNDAWTTATATGGTMIVLSVVLFAIHVLTHVKNKS